MRKPFRKQVTRKRASKLKIYNCRSPSTSDPYINYYKDPCLQKFFDPYILKLSSF